MYLCLLTRPSKSCHAKNFGTHNISNRPDPLLTPPRKRPTTDDLQDSPIATSPSGSPLAGRPSNTGRYGPDGLPRTVPLSPTQALDDDDRPPEHDDQDPETKLTPSKAMAPVAERYASAAAVQRRHMTGDGVESPRPIARTLTGGSPSPRKYGGDNPICARCTKSVFFAEQVRSVDSMHFNPS